MGHDNDCRSRHCPFYTQKDLLRGKAKFSYVVELMKVKTAWVTGGSKGIGKSICQKLLENGTTVYSISRSLGHEISHPKYNEIQLDLADMVAVKHFLTEFTSKNEIPDLLVNNAGYGAFFDWEKFPDQELIDQMQVLFTTPALFCKKFAPLMAQRESGTIVNLSSLAVLYPLPFMPIYNSGKAALSSLTQSLALQYKDGPKFIDFRMGDIKTAFNDSCIKQSEFNDNRYMKSAWKQIERQLHGSPKPDVAADQILSAVYSSKEGTIYGGGFFQSWIAPFLYNFINSRMVNKILRKRYLQYTTV